MNFSPADIRVMVRVITRRTGDPIHDEDLLQEASLRAITAFRNRRDIRYPRAFLMKVVQNTVSDYWRRQRLARDSRPPEAERISAPSFEDDLDHRRQLHMLREALGRLSPGKRATLNLFYMEDRPVAEIARLQRKSVSAVKMDLMRSRRQLFGLFSSLAKNSKNSVRPKE
jgi:RNA polymerase sigma-70 factor (ECF subfamily)